MTQKGRLEELTFELTRKCPLRCVICSSNGGKCYPREFDINRIKSIVDESIKMGVKHVSLSGGEPLTRADIIEICSFIKRKGLSLDMYSCGNIEGVNGTPSSVPYELIDGLKKAGIDRMIFAIHGCSSQTHDRTTTMRYSYENLIESMRRAIGVGLTVEFHFVPTRINYRSLPRVMNLMRKLDGKRLSVLRFVPQGRGMANRDELELASNEIGLLKDIMLGLHREHDESEFRIGAPFNSFHLGAPVPCTAGIDKATIRADGEVFPCVSMKGLIKRSNGNSLWNHSLQSIWREAELFQWVRAYMSMVLSEDSCSRCNDSFGCGGGCLTQRLIEGLPKMVDSYCLENISEALENLCEAHHDAESAPAGGFYHGALSSR